MNPNTGTHQDPFNQESSLNARQDSSSDSETDRPANKKIRHPGENRRIRNSTGRRDFKCGCDKEYLSYPAIYTHVRIKHDGNFPKNSFQIKDGEFIPLLSNPGKSNKNSILRSHHIEDCYGEEENMKNEFRNFLRSLKLNIEPPDVIPTLILVQNNPHIRYCRKVSFKNLPKRKRLPKPT